MTDHAETAESCPRRLRTAATVDRSRTRDGPFDPRDGAGGSPRPAAAVPVREPGSRFVPGRWRIPTDPPDV